MGFFLTPRHWHTAARAPPEVSSVMFRDFLIYGPVKVSIVDWEWGRESMFKSGVGGDGAMFRS
jgi:hypothetical protein